jgi:hypothetical protein
MTSDIRQSKRERNHERDEVKSDHCLQRESERASGRKRKGASIGSLKGLFDCMSNKGISGEKMYVSVKNLSRDNKCRRQQKRLRRAEG